MANRRSTVQFTDVTEPLLKDLENSGFDLRCSVNGALVVFSELSGDEQKKAVSKANGSEFEVLKGPEAEFRRRVLEILQEAQAVGGRKKRDRQAKSSKSGQSP